jgi:hypothetical protein
MVHDHNNPTAIYPDLIFSPIDGLPREHTEEFENIQTISQGTSQELCRACGWNTYHELTSSYIPRIRIGYTRVGTGLGLLWDHPNDGRLGNDYITYQFLRSCNVQSIPLVKEMRELGVSTDGVQFTLMSRAKGVPLGSIWHTLSLEEKTSCNNQMAAALRELHRFTAPYP